MARSFAHIMTAIWDDDDFLALTERAQRVYMLLVTQKDISAAGTLPLRARRWASKAKDTTGATIAEGLKELEQARFIVADKATEELLVRSFVRWDKGYGNRNRRPVILRAASEVDSPHLRSALLEEFVRVGLPTEGLSGGPSIGHLGGASTGAVEGDSDMASVIDIAEAREERLESLSAQVEGPSDAHVDAVSTLSGVVGGYVSTSYATTHNPQPIPPPAGAAEPLGTQAIIGNWIDACRKRPPRNVIGQISKHVKALLEEGIEPDDVLAGLTEWASKSGLHPSTLPSVVNGVMNRATRAPAVVTKPSTTDARVAAAQALKAHFAADPNPFALPAGGAS